MKAKIFTLMSTALVLASCCNNDNPLLQKFDTPFQTPPFDKIEIAHFKPAFQKAIKENNKEIESIVNNKEAATFDNTILALNNSGSLLRQVELIFSCMNENMSDDAYQALSAEVIPMLSAHSDEISMNDKLFTRIKTLHDNRDALGLDPLAMRTLEKYYKDYVRRGAGLNPEQKEQLKKLNSEIATGCLKYSENLLKENNAFKLVINNTDDLAGLSKDVIAAAAEEAKTEGMDGKWVFTTSKPSMLPFLEMSAKPELREKLYNAYYNRANNDNEFDNKEILSKIVSLKTQKANLLGYNTFAELAVEKNMAKTPENVYGLLMQLWTPAIEQSKVELKELQKLADKDGITMKGSDWWYYSAKLRKEKFDLSEDDLKPYLKLENVREGMFFLANKLFGITFEKNTNIPIYHPDVETFEVKDAAGKHMAILYMDYHPRASKGGGAWCSELRSYNYNNGEEILPLITISCNFTKPVGDTPALLSWEETETLFHEFGHALQGMFTRGKYAQVAGTLALDMVELPSQIMENWVAEPELMKMYARHYQTEEVIPDALIEKIHASSKFNQGWITTEHIAAALLDMDWHSGTSTEPQDAAQFEQSFNVKYGMIPEILPRYRSTFFSHIFSGGFSYSAGYYVYTWAGVLDTDAFQAFKETGDIYNQEVAEKYRKYILEEGGYDEGMVQYLKFRGSEPSVKPLLEKRGFL